MCGLYETPYDLKNINLSDSGGAELVSVLEEPERIIEELLTPELCISIFGHIVQMNKKYTETSNFNDICDNFEEYINISSAGTSAGTSASNKASGGSRKTHKKYSSSKHRKQRSKNIIKKRNRSKSIIKKRKHSKINKNIRNLSFKKKKRKNTKRKIQNNFIKK